MTLSRSPAQSLFSLCSGAESGIKRIVIRRGFVPALTHQDLSRKRGPSSRREESQLKKNNASQLQLSQV